MKLGLILGALLWGGLAQASDSLAPKPNCRITVKSTRLDGTAALSYYRIPAESEADCAKASQLYAQNDSPKQPRAAKKATFKWISMRAQRNS